MSFVHFLITCVTLATNYYHFSYPCHKRGNSSNLSSTPKLDNLNMYKLDLITNLRTRKLLLLLELSFLKSCRSEDVFPNFIQNNAPSNLNGFHLKKRVLSTKKSLLRAAIKDTRSNLARTELQLYKTHSDFMFYFHPIVWNILDTISWAHAYAKEKGKKIILNKKLANLIRAQKPRVPKTHPNPPPNHPPTLPNNVVNLSNLTISPDHLNTLAFGLNFAHHVPKSIFLHDLICNVDFGITRSLPQDVAIVAKYDVKSSIDNFKQISLFDSFNLINSLAKKDIFVVKSDKGNNTVLINKHDYDNHLFNLLDDSTTYCKIEKTPQ